MKELPFPVLKKCPCVVVSHTGCPVALLGERYLKWARIMAFPRMSWLLLGRRWGWRWMGPGPEPGVNPGVSSVQWRTPSYWRAKSDPESLEQKPEGQVWASYACTCTIALQGNSAGARWAEVGVQRGLWCRLGWSWLQWYFWTSPNPLSL